MTTQEMLAELIATSLPSWEAALEDLLTAALLGEIATDQSPHIQVSFDTGVWDSLGIPKRPAFAKPPELTSEWSLMRPLPEAVAPAPKATA